MGNRKRLSALALAAGLAALAVAILVMFRVGPFSSRPQQPEATPAPTGADRKVLAQVGDKTITDADLEAYLIRRYARESLQTLIDREVVRQEASELGVAVSREEVDRELQRMQQGYDSEEQFYRAMLEQLGLTREQLQEDVKHRLLLEKIAILPIKVSDAEVDEYIRTHPEEFREYERYHLLKIVVRTKEQADVILGELRNGADFAQVARERSMDEASAKAGGDIGWIDEHDPFVEPALLEAAKKLKTGEISDAIAVEGGYAILFLKEKKIVNRRPAEEIRQSVRKELALQKAPPLKDVLISLREKRKVRIVDSMVSTESES